MLISAIATFHYYNGDIMVYSPGLEIRTDADITLSNGSVVSDKAYIKDHNIDWAEFPVRVYYGTTMSGLLDMIYADGIGTYIPYNGLTLGSAVTVNTSYPAFRILGGANAPYTTTTSGYVSVTVASGTAMTVETGYTCLENMRFYQATAGNDVDIIKYNSSTAAAANHNILRNIYMKNVGAGTCIFAGNNAGLYLEDVILMGNESLTAPSTTGIGIECDAGVNDPVNTYLFMRGVSIGKFQYGLWADQFAWITADEQSGFGWSTEGVKLAAAADHSIRDVWFMGTLFDYNSHNGISIDGAGEAIMIHVDGCHIYTTGDSDYGNGITANNVDGLYVSNSYIHVVDGAGASPNTGINLYAKVQHAFISGCLIDAPSYGIEVSAQTGANISHNIHIIGNSFESVTNSVVVGSGNKNYIIALNIGPANSDSGSNNKFVDHNIVEA